MPWYDNTPSNADLEFWKYERLGILRRVAYWPHPNTIRIDPRYRMKHTNPPLIPVASRYGVMYTEKFDDYDDSKPDRNGFGWFDFQVRGENHIGVTTGPNADGYSFEIDIKSVDELPFLLERGISMKIEVSHPTFGNIEQHGEWGLGIEQIWWQHNMSTNFWHGGGRWVFYDADEGWPFDLEIDVFASDECYQFPQTPVGMAAMNGTDAYIKLNDLISFSSAPFKLSCEIRLNQTINHWPILGRQFTGGFFGMEGDDIVFGNLQLDTSWTPVTDVWFTWVYEFESETQLQHKLTIAGTVVKDATHSRQFPTWDTIGVYRQGISGTLWADMDVRDLKIEAGTPGDYTTLLDMPLRENALDIGPQANHGTTFNMALPSV